MMKRLAFVTAVVAVCAIAYGYFDADGNEHPPRAAVDRVIKTREVLSGSCGPNLRYELDTDSHVLTISGTGTMTNFEYRDNAPWYSNRLSIERIVVEEGVTSIGQFGFQYCENVVNISLPSTLTLLGRWSLNHFHSLPSITLPPSLQEIKQDALTHAYSLTSLLIPASVTSLEGDPCGNCFSLKSIEVDESNTRYKSIDGVLYDVNNGILVQYPAGKEDNHFTIPATVKTIGRYAFIGSTNLQSVFIPPGLKSLVQGSFSDCIGLTSITIPTSVTWIDYGAFENCSSLQSVSYLGVDNPSSSDVFFDCSSLTAVCVPADYSTDSFCDKQVTCKASLSSEDFVDLPNQCFGVTCDGTDITVQQTEESVAWEEQSNGCVERQCYNESGLAQWGMCNDTEVDDLLCTKDTCVSKDSIDDHKWEVVIEIEEECGYVNMTEIEMSMKKLSNVDISKLTIAADVTEQGCFVKIVVYLDDEQVAKKLGDDIDHIKPDNCEYGILCHKKSVHVKSLTLASGASMHYISIFAIMMSFVLMGN